MTCRALRLFIVGLIGTWLAGGVAGAGELTPGQFQFQSISIPKRIDLAVKPANVTGPQAADTSLAGSPLSMRTPLSPLSGLSLNTLSPPAAGGSPSDDQPALSERNGNIRYSVIPNAGFTPFVGIGAGRATGLLTSGLSHPTPYDTADSLHSYQGQAGFAYRLDKDTSLDLDYRMSNTQRPNVPMIDNANIPDQGRDRAAILSLHYTLDPVLRRPPE
ncbi:MAG: hypothetical protein JO128_16195 [Alphaproteobacteria bacterium]|nr:hypothetical protein [Alphaproteobacteria bacterium]